MRLLVLGGTVFLSRAVAEAAGARGHEVTCACRGVSGAVPDGARLVTWDRATDEPPAELTGASFDAVVDVSRYPSQVRTAVARFPEAFWVFVSSISVYADHRTPRGTPDSLPLHPALHTDDDPASAPAVYGAMKVGCEEIVRSGATSSVVVRPGLIVGPGDPTGRFSYWPSRFSQAEDGDPVLAPGEPGAKVQVIDVGDLASWIVHLAKHRHEGLFDATGQAMPMSYLLGEVASGLGVEPRWVWAPDDFLVENAVEPWTGARSMPLWLPRREYDGMLDHDVSAATEAGLTTRPIADTARDTAAWLAATPDAPVTGLTLSEEQELLLVAQGGRA